jgi:hypothetical protein
MSETHRSYRFLRIILLLICWIHLDAGQGLPPMPRSREALKWTKIDRPPADALILVIDIEDCNLGSLPVVSAENGREDVFGHLSEFDYSPCQDDANAVAVFVKQNDWYLIHSKKEGWYWLLLRDIEFDQYNPHSQLHCSSIVRDPWYGRKGIVVDGNINTPSETFDWHEFSEIWLIEPVNGEIMRARPSIKSRSRGKVEGPYFRLLDYEGDWVKVQEAADYQTVDIGKDGKKHLLVKWSHHRPSWIRWRVVGPVLGSHRTLLRGLLRLDAID